ncbi:MAG TPA: TIGR01777 family oxidoreductase [Terriglobales bacterium]
MDQRKILISGASGLIGTAVGTSLAADGCEISRLVRGKAVRKGDVPWNPAQPIAPEKVSGFDVVIHLAGEGVFGVWTREKKRRIHDSRIFGTKNLAEGLARAAQKPRVFISASAIGYYGDRGDEVLREESSSGAGFLAEVCREWEAATMPAIDPGIRIVNLRTGHVLSPAGGILKKMLPPFRLGLGGKIGDGKQWQSWIHMGDWLGALRHIMNNDSLRGPVNLVGPNPVTNGEFTKTLAGVLSRPAFFTVPGLALKAALGKEAANEMLLSGQRVEPAKLKASGYQFQFPNLHVALRDLLRK